MQPVRKGEGGSRLAIVLNGSPLFTGGAGSGESNIRQWIIENDLFDAIIALPTDLFYNTGISTSAEALILVNRRLGRRWIPTVCDSVGDLITASLRVNVFRI